MAFNFFMQPSLPPDEAESPSLGAKRIRDFKAAIMERLLWLYGFDAAGTEDKVGAKYLPLNKQTSAPTAESDKLPIYAKEENGVLSLFLMRPNGQEMRLTKDGFLNVENVLGAPTEYTGDDNGTVFQSECNGFILFLNPEISGVVYMYISDDGIGNWSLHARSDKTGCIPIRKGIYYKFSGLTEWATPIKAFFIPMGG